jgi:Malonate decarboxylase, alpha subunit, transporter
MRGSRKGFVVVEAAGRRLKGDPQSLRVSQLLEDGKLEMGAVHTYVELYARPAMSLEQELDSSSAAGELSCLPVPSRPVRAALHR